jgi:hypothetical protein
MSAMGQKQTDAAHKLMSALPPKADSCSAQAHVRFGPIADIPTNLRPEAVRDVEMQGVTVLSAFHSEPPRRSIAI